MSYRSQLFGLDVSLPERVQGCPPREWGGAREPLIVRWVEQGALDATGTRVVDQPHLTVDAVGAGYLITWPEVGRFLLDGEGHLDCGPCDAARPVWERLLLAQLLPLAATMAGVEVLHASAVIASGKAVGVLGPSGAGKSTTAAALVRAGARFFGDDVLGLTRAGEGVVAHPGPALLRLVDPDGGEKAGRQEQGEGGAYPLGALLFLSRDGDQPPDVGNPVGFRELAGATFNLLVDSPQRLERHLDLCAALAAQVPCVQARFPVSSTPGQTAGALLDWVAVA